MRVLELFSGYGSASFALKRIGVPYELVGYSDIDKYANECFKQNHCPDDVEDKLRLGDVKLINPYELDDFDLLTGGFPCQAFSNVGKMKGELDPRGTLFNEIIRIAEVKKPKYMLLENVKGFTFKKFKDAFDKVLSELDRIGYQVRWKVLNSKDYGIPQNRERVWFVCFRNDNDGKYPWKDFEFPEKVELKLFLKDILEDEVDEKYYLKEEQINNIIKNFNTKGVINVNPSGKSMNGVVNNKNIANTVSTNKGEGQKIMLDVSQIRREGQPKVYDSVSKTLNTAQGGGHTPLIFSQPLRFLNRNQKNLQSDYAGCVDSSNTSGILIKNATKRGYQEVKLGDGINFAQPNSKTRRGRVLDGVSSTLQCDDSRGVLSDDFRIRKLTPRECFRLMGFLDDEIKLEGLSNTQRYKLAGNGQDVNVVSLLFEAMELHLLS